MTRALRVLVAAALCLVATVALPAAATAADPVITADFAKKRSDLPSLNGFLHGMGPENPADARITPLQPGLWRAIPTTAPFVRATSFGARYTVVLSDTYGYPIDNWGGRGKAPYEDYGAWANHVRSVAKRAKQAEVIWDIWNEPDDPYFWNGTREQYFMTYLVAYNTLRDELGTDPIMSGPSTSAWNREFIEQFLNFCVAYGCDVDAVSWHELFGQITGIDNHLLEAREDFVENPRYASLGLSEVHVNEVGSAADQYHPGEIVGELHYLERGGADAAARACWDAMVGRSNCQRDTLDGLLTPRLFEPRAAWWAAKEYADGRRARVATTSSQQYVVGLGSYKLPSPTSGQLLIGRMALPPGGSNAPKTSVDVKLEGLNKLTFLKDATRVRVQIDRIPDTGEAALPAPIPVRTRDVRITDRSAELTVTDVRLHEAFLLTLSAMPRS